MILRAHRIRSTSWRRWLFSQDFQKQTLKRIEFVGVEYIFLCIAWNMLNGYAYGSLIYSLPDPCINSLCSVWCGCMCGSRALYGIKPLWLDNALACHLLVKQWSVMVSLVTWHGREKKTITEKVGLHYQEWYYREWILHRMYILLTMDITENGHFRESADTG